MTYAGPAPLDGDDSKERQFLAGRSWNGGPSRYADARYEPAGSIPPRRLTAASRLRSQPPAGLGRTPELSRSLAVAEADAGASAPAGWSPFAYRSGLAGR